MNKRNLSVQELRDMLLAQRFAEDKLGARLNKEALTMLSEQTFIQKRAYFWFFSCVATNLCDPEDHQLLSPDDDLFSRIYFLISKVDGHGELIASEEAQLATTIEVLVQCYSALSERFDLFVETWRWINAVMDLFEEISVPVAEIISQNVYSDEVTRRLFTKKEFLQRKLVRLVPFCRKGLANKMALFFIKVRLRKKFGVIRKVTKSFFQEEAKRIYG